MINTSVAFIVISSRLVETVTACLTVDQPGCSEVLLPVNLLTVWMHHISMMGVESMIIMVVKLPSVADVVDSLPEMHMMLLIHSFTIFPFCPPQEVFSVPVRHERVLLHQLYHDVSTLFFSSGSAGMLTRPWQTRDHLPRCLCFRYRLSCCRHLPSHLRAASTHSILAEILTGSHGGPSKI